MLRLHLIKATTLSMYVSSFNVQVLGLSPIPSDTGACVMPVEVDGWSGLHILQRSCWLVEGYGFEKADRGWTPVEFSWLVESPVFHMSRKMREFRRWEVEWPILQASGMARSPDFWEDS